MAESAAPGPSSTVRLLLVAIVVSALVGGTVGYVFAPKTVTGTAPPSTYVPQTREFYLFTSTLPFNESVMGVPHDTFTPDRMLVYKGDTVVIHYFNAEDVVEDHTFTMQVLFTWTNGTAWPANGINYVVHQNQEVNITIVASTSGIFRYYCVYHEPTTYGYLAVLEP